MNTYAISSEYSCITVTSLVELPEEVSWEDIENYYVKWDTLFYVLKGSDEYQEVPMGSDVSEAIERNRPISTEVYETDEEGNLLYKKEL